MSRQESRSFTVTKKVPVDRGTAAIIDRLCDQRDEIVTLEKRLAAGRKRRLAFVKKLRHAGLTLRQIEGFAGISNPALSQQLSAPVTRGEKPDG